jgi:hypothetical protein
MKIETKPVQPKTAKPQTTKQRDRQSKGLRVLSSTTL